MDRLADSSITAAPSMDSMAHTPQCLLILLQFPSFNISTIVYVTMLITRSWITYWYRRLKSTGGPHGGLYQYGGRNVVLLISDSNQI